MTRYQIELKVVIEVDADNESNAVGAAYKALCEVDEIDEVVVMLVTHAPDKR